MKFKRWIALLLIAVMTLVTVTGCGNKEDDDFTAESDKLLDLDSGDDTDEPDKEENTKGDTDEPKEDTDEPTDDNEEPKDDTVDTKDDTEEPKDDTEEPKDDTEEPKNDISDKDISALKADTSGTPITFLMQNLRTTGNQTADAPTDSSNSPYNRTNRFKTMVQTHEPDVLLCQEGTKAWINFFQTDEYFTKNYTLLYKYRSESQSVLESTPVLYKTSKYTELDSGHFWLSETPNVESVSYEAGEGHIRICTWVKLKDKSTGAVFYAYTAHVDTNGETPMKSMQQFYDLFNKAGKNEYCFVGGDFNFKYESAEYKMSIDWEEVMAVQDVALNLADDGLCEVGEFKGSLTGGFSDGISPDPNVGGAGQLDHFFARHMSNMTFDYFAFDYTHYDNSANNVAAGYISDHYGLLAKVRIGTGQDYSAYHIDRD